MWVIWLFDGDFLLEKFKTLKSSQQDKILFKSIQNYSIVIQSIVCPLLCIKMVLTRWELNK